MSDTFRTGEATLRALLDAGEQRLAVLLDRSQRLMAERDPATLLRLVTSAAVDIAQARACGVGITDDNGGFERLVSSDDATAADVEWLFAPRADHPARRAVESRSIVLDGSCLFVPIASPSRVYGCLALIDKIGASEYTDVDTQLAATFAAQAGIVYENARLLARLEAQTDAFRVQEEQTEFLVGSW
jgi:GAF domain-containing protein